MNKIVKGISAAVVAGGLILGVTACGPTQRDQRAAAQNASQITNSLEKQNLKKKLDKEEDPNAIRYVYILSYANIIGYYVIQGKVSSSGSQIGPEQEIINGGGNGNVLDSAQDDGTYGDGDPGVFFFTTDGTMVETSLDYIISDRPIAVNAPVLGGSAK